MAPGEIVNQDIFGYALYRLQGAGRFVDVEDVYIECWRLSPSRFSWRTRPEFPSDKVGLKAQGDFERSHPDFVLKTPNGLGRQLTAEGVAWVRSKLPELERLGSGATRAPATRRASHRLISDLTKHPSFRAFKPGAPVDLSKVQLAEILNCAPDSPASVWKERLETLLSAAEDSERSDLVAFLRAVERSLTGQ